ncbi:isocitrate/isopropylmalate family dehydrogenase [Vibrio sp. PP-XX7]
MKTFNIAVIPGDGIGNEVIPAGQRVLEIAAKRHGVTIQWTRFDWSCETYKLTGQMMPDDGLEQLKQFDAIYLGAVGYPGVPDHLSLWRLVTAYSPGIFSSMSTSGQCDCLTV